MDEAPKTVRLELRNVRPTWAEFLALSRFQRVLEPRILFRDGDRLTDRRVSWRRRGELRLSARGRPYHFERWPRGETEWSPATAAGEIWPWTELDLAVAELVRGKSSEPAPSIPRKNWSDAVRARVSRRYGGKCYVCGEPVVLGDPGDRGATLDHVVPLFLGGEDSESNLALSCRRCNLAKGSVRPKVDPRGPLWPEVAERFRLAETLDHLAGERFGGHAPGCTCEKCARRVRALTVAARILREGEPVPPPEPVKGSVR